MPEDLNFSFSQIPIPERQSKPRSKGLTMMIDWGLPLGLQLDCIETHGLYVDEASIGRDDNILSLIREHLTKGG